MENLNSSSRWKQIAYIIRVTRPFLILILVCIIVGIMSPRFATPDNLMTILRQTSVNAVLAAGMTFVILTGGIDLSVGSVMAICGAVTASMLLAGIDVYSAVLAALVLGAAVGMVNGFLISKAKLQPFIVTLATMTILRGGTLVYTNGKPVGIGTEANARAFRIIGTNLLWGIPVPVYIMLVVFIISYITLRHLKIGRQIYALGNNEEAAYYSGIKTDRTKVFVYTVCSLMAALAGIILTSRLGSASPQAGNGYELDAIAAVVLGGTSMVGGAGSILGSMVGALIIGVLNNALNLLEIHSYYKDVIKGAVILAAVLLDRQWNLTYVGLKIKMQVQRFTKKEDKLNHD